MSIRTVILADLPTLYWPLDDPTGPAASDASGNGHPGVYSGTFNLAQPGPEVGTFAALFSEGALVFSVAGTPVRLRPFSMECWLGPQLIEPAQNNILYNGNGNINGVGVLLAAGTTLVQPIQVLIGGNAVGAAVGSVQVGAYHHIVLTTDVTQLTNMYIDGINVYLNQNTGPMNPIAAADKFQVGANKVGQSRYVAHAALYNFILSPAQVLAHFNSNVTPQGPQPIGGVTGIDISAILRYVSRLYQNAP